MSYRFAVAGRRRRAGLLAALALLGSACVALAGVAVVPLASAAPAPTATAITVQQVVTPSISVPATHGSQGLAYVVQDVPFRVDFATDLPLSTTKSTRVLLTVTSGPDAGSLSIPYDVPAGATSGSIDGAVLATPANKVALQVAVDAKKSDVQPGTLRVDVLKTSLSAPRGTTLTGIGGGGGPGVPCSPTPEDPVCGDLMLPDTGGVVTDLLLSQGSCDSLCNPLGSFLQLLVGVDPGVYNAQHPIVFVAKCDKSLCGGKGIKSYGVKVALAAGDPLTTSPACAAKGVIDTGDFCTDYVQSSRDNAGDVLLYVLLAKDAKIIFG